MVNEKMKKNAALLVLCVICWAFGQYGVSVLWILIPVIITLLLSKEDPKRKDGSTQDETVECLNLLIASWLNVNSDTLEDLTVNLVNDILKRRSSWLDRCTQCYIDKMATRIHNLHIITGGYALGEKTVTITADTEVTWKAFSLTISPSPGVDSTVQLLKLSGTLNITFFFSKHLPFPRISKVTICFQDKPDLLLDINRKQIKFIPIDLSFLKGTISNGLVEPITLFEAQKSKGS